MYTAQTTTDPEILEKIIQLRYDILRKPWNKSIETATDELERQSVNVYVEDHATVIACGRLQNNGKGIGQIRYMAVSDAFQGKGLGKLVLKKLEEEALSLKINTIELQARENAVAFYKANGYVVKETSFKLWDLIQHYLMVKAIG